jgi:hypothetical protein
MSIYTKDAQGNLVPLRKGRDLPAKQRTEESFCSKQQAVKPAKQSEEVK